MISMVDRTYRSGRDRFDRDRGYGRQAEQFDSTDSSWRDDERGHGQMGEGWREEDYGQFDTASQSYGRDREAARDWGRDPSYRRAGQYNAYAPPPYSYGTHAGEGRGFASFTGNDFGGRDFTAPRYTSDRNRTSSYGAGSRLAANRGEWREDYGASPSYRGTYGEHHERGWLERTGDEIASWFGDEDADRRRRMDHRGHGPSGYTRSDERIREDANDRLTDDWGVDARDITVSVTNGEVTLDGTVPSREQKRRAEDVVDDLSGVKNVQNNLRVKETAGWDRNNRGDTETTGTV
jgi:osmotically-inducible protein OsmY